MITIIIYPSFIVVSTSQANKSYDSSDNEGSPSPPPLNASSEGCETNVDPY